MLDEFMASIFFRYPNVFVQFEDFASEKALDILNRYRKRSPARAPAASPLARSLARGIPPPALGPSPKFAGALRRTCGVQCGAT